MIDETEIVQLSKKYGRPIFREHDLNADKYLFESRTFRAQSRRGEVVMVIVREPGFVLVHSKGWYKPPVLRLLTGGISYDEPVEQTLIRELAEETGYKLDRTRFLALHRCHLHYKHLSMIFDSCIFWLNAPGIAPSSSSAGEDIKEYKWVPIGALEDIAANLRATPPPRRRWGEWRALSHELTLEILEA